MTSPEAHSRSSSLDNSSLTSGEKTADEQTVAAKSRIPELSLLGVALIWGVNIPLMKSGLDRMDWYSFNAVRLTLSVVVLASLGWRERRGGCRPSGSLSKGQVLIFALLASIVYQLLFLLGISGTTSGNTGLIMSTVPMWTALAARLFLQERLRPIAWFGLYVAFAGTLIVALQKNDLSIRQDTLAGNLFMLGAALSWSAATVYSRRLLTSISPLQLSAWSAVIGLPVHLLVAAVFAQPSSISALGEPAVWLTVLYSGIFSTGIALPMWNFGVRHSGAAQAAVFQNLIPVTAMIAAWGFRGETVTLAQLTGGGMIVGGLLIMLAGKSHA